MNRVINYLGKFLSEFSGKLALPGKKEKMRKFRRVLKVKFQEDTIREVAA
jgi:hypothetical protein